MGNTESRSSSNAIQFSVTPQGRYEPSAFFTRCKGLAQFEFERETMPCFNNLSNSAFTTFNISGDKRRGRQ